MSDPVKNITETVKASGFEINDDQARALYRFYELLIEKNKVMNLTAVTEFDEVVRKHFADSLTLGRVIDLSGVKTLIDVGTGAGFPGIPLAICYPDISFTLMDSLNKRILFLDEVVKELNLTNVDLVHERAEILAQKKEYRSGFDLAVSRAVANLSTLSEYCLPFVRRGGAFVSYKSLKTEEELTGAAKALAILGGKLERREDFELFDMSRSLLLIRKEKDTPKKYPRKAGLPAKEPLGA